MPRKGRGDGIFARKSLANPSSVRISTWPAALLAPYKPAPNRPALYMDRAPTSFSESIAFRPTPVRLPWRKPFWIRTDRARSEQRFFHVLPALLAGMSMRAFLAQWWQRANFGSILGCSLRHGTDNFLRLILRDHFGRLRLALRVLELEGLGCAEVFAPTAVAARVKTRAVTINLGMRADFWTLEARHIEQKRGPRN